jgi:hypothetical protein
MGGWCQVPQDVAQLPQDVTQKLLVASQCSRRDFVFRPKVCFLILQAFSGLSVLPQGLFFSPKSAFLDFTSF